MLTVSRIQEEKEHIIEGLKKRGIDAASTIDKILNLNDKRRTCQYELDSALNESKTISKEIGKLYASGKTNEAEQKKLRTAELKELVKKYQDEMENASTQMHELLITLPNVPHRKVRAGKSEADNEIVKKATKIPVLPEWAKPHWDLIEQSNIISMDAGVTIAGGGFPVYIGKGAKLQRALIRFFLEKAEEAGYLEVIPPLIVNKETAFATGQLPDKEGQMYHITGDDFYLIPTAEVPITNLYRDKILDEKDFPVKLVGHTPCFRREAGSYGKDVRGLNRVHQFEKVEIVQIQHPDKSYETLDEMVAFVSGLLEDLHVPYRIARLCAGDMGFTAAMTYDFEIYAAGQKKWLEVSSVSNFETFQSNRMKLRYRDTGKKTQLAHTLNGSALALARLVAVLIENNQTPDAIEVPETLIPYTGFDKIELR